MACRDRQVSRGSLRRLDRWFDVVIHAEKVSWIVFVFQGDQAVVIGPVSFTGDSLSLVGNVIPKGARDQKRLHGTPALSRPLNVLFEIGWLSQFDQIRRRRGVGAGYAYTARADLQY
jgi:hypothetical protein